MKKRFLWVIPLIIAIALSATCGCSGEVNELIDIAGDVVDLLDSADYEEETGAAAETAAKAVTEAVTEAAAQAFDIHNIDIPAYSGKPIIQINDNVPFFTEDEITDEFFISLSELDELGRCGSNMMCADEPHIQTGERSNISDIHPSGWHKGGFYERSHLLMWKLSGCNVEENLISGTDTFNQESMLEYEERVTAYLWRHEDNHVMYRVSPLFEGDNLIATGVLMEAWSVEDSGTFSFCIFVYNIEPDYTIDYATGDYSKN